MDRDHVRVRQTLCGRWLPVVFYFLNLSLWIVIVMLAGAWDLLGLAVLPLPFLVVYIVRTHRNVS